MPRRFITTREIDQLADEGAAELRLDADTTVTDLARERARERGIALTRSDAPVAAGGTAPAAVPAVPPADRGRVRAEVRAAVIAQLGTEPAQLDRIIDQVLDGGG
jgi:hypothetical protein